MRKLYSTKSRQRLNSFLPNRLRRLFLFGALCSGTFFFTQAAEYSRPNVIFILIDDMGFGDLSCWVYQFRPLSRYRQHRNQARYLLIFPGCPSWVGTIGQYRVNRLLSRSLKSRFKSPVRRGVVNCCFVIERHDTENSIIEFLDPAPETVRVLFLFFHTDWILAHVDAPSFCR